MRRHICVCLKSTWSNLDFYCNDAKQISVKTLWESVCVIYNDEHSSTLKPSVSMYWDSLLAWPSTGLKGFVYPILRTKFGSTRCIDFNHFLKVLHVRIASCTPITSRSHVPNHGEIRTAVSKRCGKVSVPHILLIVLWLVVTYA